MRESGLLRPIYTRARSAPARPRCRKLSRENTRQAFRGRKFAIGKVGDKKKSTLGEKDRAGKLLAQFIQRETTSVIRYVPWREIVRTKTRADKHARVRPASARIVLTRDADAR